MHKLTSWWPKPNQTHCDEICSCHPKVKSITCSWMWLKSSQEGYHLGLVLRCFKIIGWLNASPALFSPLPYCILEAMVKWWLGCLQNSQSKLCQYISIDFKIHVFFLLGTGKNTHWAWDHRSFPRSTVVERRSAFRGSEPKVTLIAPAQQVRRRGMGKLEIPRSESMERGMYHNIYCIYKYNYIYI